MAQRRWQIAGLGVVGPFLLVMLLLEAGSYLFGSFEGPNNPLRGGFVQVVGRHDPLLFWSLEPNATDPSGRIRINRHGLRGPEVEPKRTDELRILSLGESTTLAPRLAYRDSYSARLERLLEQQATFPVRVLNAGVSGYTLFQGYQYLRHRGLELDPDIVVLYFGYNDFLPVSFLANRSGDASERVSGLTDRELFEKRRSLRERTHSLLTRHSNLFRALAYGRRPEQDRIPEAAIEEGHPRVPESDRRELLEQTIDLCRENAIDLMVVVPWYREFELHAPLLRELEEREHVVVVDLLEEFDREPPPKPRADYFSDAVHPNAAGHELIASAILKHFRRLPSWQTAEGAPSTLTSDRASSY